MTDLLIVMKLSPQKDIPWLEIRNRLNSRNILKFAGSTTVTKCRMTFGKGTKYDWER